MSEKLAIMRDVHFGVGDYGKVCMWFTAHVSENVAALQVLSVEQAVSMIQKFGVNNVSRLEGKTIWVEEGDGLIRYLKPAIV